MSIALTDGVIDALEHMVSAGERWDTLAWRYYGDPHAFGRIIAANPALDISTVLEAGTVVLIPLQAALEVAQKIANEDLPPWKQS